MEPDFDEVVETLRNYMTRGEGQGTGRGGYKARPQTVPSTPTKPCFSCRGEGHWSRECPYNASNWPVWLKKAIEAQIRGEDTSRVPDQTSAAPAKTEPPIYPTATIRIVTETSAQPASAVTGVGLTSSGQPPAGGGGGKKKRNRNKKK